MKLLHQVSLITMKMVVKFLSQWISWRRIEVWPIWSSTKAKYQRSSRPCSTINKWKRSNSLRYSPTQEMKPKILARMNTTTLADDKNIRVTIPLLVISQPATISRKGNTDRQSCFKTARTHQRSPFCTPFTKVKYHQIFGHLMRD